MPKIKNENYSQSTTIVSLFARQLENAKTAENMVDCPICQTKVTEKRINKHLDENCLKVPEPTKITSPLPHSSDKQARQVCKSIDSLPDERLLSKIKRLSSDTPDEKMTPLSNSNFKSARMNLAAKFNECELPTSSRCTSSYSHNKTNGKPVSVTSNSSKAFKYRRKRLSLHGGITPTQSNENLALAVTASQQKDEIVENIATFKSDLPNGTELRNCSTSEINDKVVVIVDDDREDDFIVSPSKQMILASPCTSTTPNRMVDTQPRSSSKSPQKRSVKRKLLPENSAKSPRSCCRRIFNESAKTPKSQTKKRSRRSSGTDVSTPESSLTKRTSPRGLTAIHSPRNKEFLNLIPEQLGDVKCLLSPAKETSRNPIGSASISLLRKPCSNDEVSHGHNTEQDAVVSSSDEQMRYYLKNFLFVIKTVLDDKDDFILFEEADLSVVRNFLLLSGKAQKLYVRLFARKYFWILASKMKYPEIDENLADVLQELHSNDFLEFEDNLSCLTTILKLLPASRIKDLCKKLNLQALPQKSAMQSCILKHSKQRSVFPGLRVDQTVTLEAKKALNRCCHLLEVPRRVFIRILMLFSLTETTEDNRHEDRPVQLETLLRVNFGLLVYPPYQILRQVKIFRFREDLIRYEKACLLEMDILNAMENKDWEEAEKLCSVAVDEFRLLLQDDCITRHDVQLPDYLRKFTAGHIYARCLNQCVELLQKLRQYESAIVQLRSLLDQGIYCQRYRGHWIERIALNLDQHLNKPLEALKVIADALGDPSVTQDHKLAVHQRAVRISNAKKSKELVKKALLKLPPVTIRNAPEVHIEGKKLDISVPGYKTAFVSTDFSESGNNFDLFFCSVEEFAIMHYRSLGFPSGLHGEGSTLVSFFGLLFWEIIYQSGTADAFRSPHQSYPLDLISAEFYARRRSAIEERLLLITSSSIKDLIVMMNSVWTNHNGQSSLVNWNLFGSFERLASLATCMGSNFLALVCKRFAVDYRQYRSGVPDIVVWNVRAGEWKMVEVKGPGDKLSHKQLLWIDYLLQNEVHVEVCYVKAVGGKKIKKKSANLPCDNWNVNDSNLNT